ncbi:MAG TPA: histidine kinase, partial [Actinomycetota bacterium]|nr:histidine kinase [Actinomycetota bacterium]
MRRRVLVLAWVVSLAIALVAAAVVIVLVIGEVPEGERWSVLLGALAGVAVAAALLRWLQPAITRALLSIVHRERTSPDALARGFASRMSRSVPLDELVLQAAESMREGLHVRAVEVWRLADGALQPWLGDPGFRRAPVPLGSVSPSAIVQAGLSGHGWLSVWLPQMLEGREDAYVRLAPMASAGELQGVVVVERPVDAPVFASDEERALVEVSRHLGVALHNAQLDSALQASLDEVRRQAAELQASRGRIVASADQARRTIERNLHDGAQQHLVALAVQLKLVRQMAERDPSQVTDRIDALSEAVDETLQELRDLAHGIYPPLLADKGLPDALTSAARRAALPVTVVADGLGRYGADAEATVYFCVLEALQNAGKYAGDGASITVEVREEAGSLVFVVADDGDGFDVQGRGTGAGFTNMLDRLGALGGTLRVESAPGRGTKVTGVVTGAA